MECYKEGNYSPGLNLLKAAEGYGDKSGNPFSEEEKQLKDELYDKNIEVSYEKIWKEFDRNKFSNVLYCIDFLKKLSEESGKEVDMPDDLECIIKEELAYDVKKNPWAYNLADPKSINDKVHQMVEKYNLDESKITRNLEIEQAK